MNLSGEWLGFYTHGAEYGELAETSVSVRFQLTDNDGFVTGICNDLNSTGIPADDDAVISKILMDGVFSFVKRYNFCYAMEDYATISKIADREPPNIFYMDIFDTAENCFNGKWIFQQDIKGAGSGTGKWKMFRKDFFEETL